MEIRELRSFSTAARLRSISRAARELGLGQPTVTTSDEEALLLAVAPVLEAAG
ncbi:MAG: LysR family transcriptional regulator, partial [Chloroflexi bacterium]|nr:LysR family transcriptional regulator [Chloroflexota bacterium]